MTVNITDYTDDVWAEIAAATEDTIARAAGEAGKPDLAEFLAMLADMVRLEAIPLLRQVHAGGALPNGIDPATFRFATWIMLGKLVNSTGPDGEDRSMVDVMAFSTVAAAWARAADEFMLPDDPR